jgi:glycosyltransferase involved in cell wall biosynthesis
LICKIFFSRGAKLQVQIHADVASEFWKKQSFSNRVRSHLLFVNNRYINSIRFVSKGQYEKFRKRYKTGEARIVIVPVPLNVTGVIDELPESGRSDILFIGRLHKDRGLDVFCKIVKNLNSASSEFVVNVVGAGPEKESFLKNLESICGEERVKSFGFCDNFKIQKIVKSCRLLLSTAPSESYGRAMREAIFYGIPVWSVANEGAVELQKDFGAQIVRILNPIETTDLLFREYVEFGRVRVSKSVREQINLSDTARILTLAESWL